MKRIAWMMLAASAAFAQTAPAAAPKIGEIMARVAANQAKSVEARKRYVYRQDEFMALRRSNGKVDCEGKREFTVMPAPRGVRRQVVKSEGLPKQRCTITSDGDSNESWSIMDAGQTDGLIDSQSQLNDGIPRDLFPLTAKQQRLYEYKLEGTEEYRGRKIYRVSFRPNHQRGADGDQGVWKGEAMIDAAEFEPVMVSTDLTAKVPFAVRTLLGTNVQGAGFSVSYQRVADGVWFPASFGGEFKLNVLFFFRRSISINVKNSDFKRTDVKSDVAYDKIK